MTDRYKHGLPNASLEQEVAAALEADARLEERLESVALPVEAVDDVGTGLDERGLEHVREQGQHGVQRLELGRGARAVLDAREELGQDGQVQDERSSQKRVLKIQSTIGTDLK